MMAPPIEQSYDYVQVAQLAVGDEIEWYLIASNDGWEWCRCTVLGRYPLHVRFRDGEEKILREGAKAPRLRRAAAVTPEDARKAEEVERLREVERAARIYYREFDHLIPRIDGEPYPEQRDLREALRNARTT